jgi:hypothetical protein
MSAGKKMIDKNIKKLPIERKAEIALKKAVAQAIAEHKRQGHSIAVWEKGKVNIIPPEKISLATTIERKTKRGTAPY